jgi:hypothetical protein
MQEAGRQLGRIAANDREVAWFNSGRLLGAERLLSAELVARGLLGFVRTAVRTPSLVEELRLLKFKSDACDACAWPRMR